MNKFSTSITRDGGFEDDLDVLKTMYPSYSQNDLTRKAFSLAAKYLIKEELEKLGSLGSVDVVAYFKLKDKIQYLKEKLNITDAYLETLIGRRLEGKPTADAVYIVSRMCEAVEYIEILNPEQRDLKLLDIFVNARTAMQVLSSMKDVEDISLIGYIVQYPQDRWWRSCVKRALDYYLGYTTKDNT